MREYTTPKHERARDKGKIEEEHSQKVLEISRMYLAKQIEESGWDAQIVIATYRTWSEVYIGATAKEPEMSNLQKYFDLAENPYFKEFIEGDLLKDVSAALDIHTFPGTEREDKEKIAYAIQQAFPQVAEEYSGEENE